MAVGVMVGLIVGVVVVVAVGVKVVAVAVILMVLTAVVVTVGVMVGLVVGAAMGGGAGGDSGGGDSHDKMVVVEVCPARVCSWELTKQLPRVVTHPGIALASNSLNFGVPTNPKPVSSQKASRYEDARCAI
ncbi:hypothetical protein L3X38_020372 [Prunus dulcis]|uniref:Uncharacterized protein n=1 Tax=Prunus dulcis TaxID=3755 RepID=A0AAD4WDP1_PRUDU|nr:hypothetical protein L3X38_020372 [Prunus dulcis]